MIVTEPPAGAGHPGWSESLRTSSGVLRQPASPARPVLLTCATAPPEGGQDGCAPVAWMLPQCARGVPAARRLVTSELDRWRLRPLADRVALVVTELVTNALNYGAPPCVLRLARADRMLHAAVFDAGPPFDPQRLDPCASRPCAPGEPDEPGGWGLAAIVTGYADSWLVVPVDGGKAVIASWHVR